MTHKENIGSTFRISGKPNLKRPLIILGNSIRVEFSSSASAKYIIYLFYPIYFLIISYFFFFERRCYLKP